MLSEKDSLQVEHGPISTYVPLKMAVTLARRTLHEMDRLGDYHKNPLNLRLTKQPV